MLAYLTSTDWFDMAQITIPLDGQDHVIDLDAYTVTVDGVSRPATEHERTMIDATKTANAELAELMVEREVEAVAQAERDAVLATPLSPLPIGGTTVEEIKNSAEASVQDLAAQMEAKLQALSGK
jgi:hypothetical protein